MVKLVLVIFAGIAIFSCPLPETSKDILIKSYQQQEEVVEETSYEIPANEFPEIIDKSTQSSESNGLKDSFENGLGSMWFREMTNDTYAGTISSEYAREGTYSYRVELRKSDPIIYAGKRSEISISEPEPAADERIYAFSVYLPKGGSEDYALDPNGDEIIAQWHNTADPSEEGTYPPLALHTSGDGHYVLRRCWDADPISSQEKMDKEGTKASIDLGSYLEDKGKWVDWTFHVKWGWLVSQQPIIQIYKNGSLVYELKDRPNTTNDKQGIRMKLGIYKWEWGQTEELSKSSILSDRVVYYDDVSVKQVGRL